MTIALVVWIIGGALFLLLNGRGTPPASRIESNLAELGKWAFIVGLAAWLFTVAKIIL